MFSNQVLSRDPATGQNEAKTVTNTIERHAPSVVDVVLHDAKTGHAETLTCTPEHPLFVQGQGWVEAGSLGIGTSIVSRAGPALSVTALTWKRDKLAELAAGSAGNRRGGYTVYNLTVEDDHTFFVGTANGGTWVHNALPCDAQEAYNLTQAPFRNGLTRAGNALAKHNPLKRIGNAQYPPARGNPAQINAQADEIVQEILTNPDTQWTGRMHNTDGPVTEYRAPNGQEMLFNNKNGFDSFRN